MWNYQRINFIGGWLLFAIAAIVYGMTVEPSISFWDCPEFITSAARLEVGHPPGAPFFMLLGNLFSQFASDASLIPLWINRMNALLSAGCILLLFRSITYLTRKLILKNNESPTPAQIITIMASGVVGALSYTFSDTFWYSAVEGEVYAFSSFLTALAFWIILKWDNEKNRAFANRWLVLLAYLIGLSIGVHLLNLLCIPAIVMVVYFKISQRSTLKGTLVALGGSFLLIACVLYLLIPGIVKILGYGELLMVNHFKFPFHTGTILSFLLILLLLSGVVWFTHRSGNNVANSIVVSLLVFVLGYSSYALILIRASADTPMSQQAVKDPFTLRDYLGREQYGQTPLIYGKTFAATPAMKQNKDGSWSYDYGKGAAEYQRIEATPGQSDQYVQSGYKIIEKFDPAGCMWFPRMHSKLHAGTYQAWLGKKIEQPSLKDNLRFFFGYQLNFMYWRYFLWNFAGRQNDVQSHGEKENGNWLTGISVIDHYLLGIPINGANKGHNLFYGLPLLLGLIGLGWQWKKQQPGKQQFLILFLLFFMTGIAIVIYLNQTPLQPRERDYAYAGSFYAFTIWIGMGVAGIIEKIQQLKPSLSLLTGAIGGGLLALGIPLQMVSQTWDDHDRSDRYICRDTAYNYLNSLQKEGNPIIFVNGDNDTFPLWYAIEVEGVRKDARACNLMYLTGGWYVAQMMQPAHESPGFPLSLPRSFFLDDKNYAIPVNPVIKQEYLPNGSVKEVRLKDLILDFYKRNPGTTRYGVDPFEWDNIVKYWLCNPDESLRCIPTDEIHLQIDPVAVANSGMQLPEDTKIPEYMRFDLKGERYLSRPAIVQLDLIKQCNWSRPLYVAITAPSDEYLDLSNHLVMEGLASRIVPYVVNSAEAAIDTERLYEHAMHDFRYGNLKDSSLYLDDTNKGAVRTLHNTLLVLANNLYQKGDTVRAREIMNKCNEEFSPVVLNQIPYLNLKQQQQLCRLLGTAQIR